MTPAVSALSYNAVTRYAFVQQRRQGLESAGIETIGPDNDAIRGQSSQPIGATGEG